MLSLICEINHKYVIKSYYLEMVYILEELMEKGTVKVVILPFFELGLYKPYAAWYSTFTKKYIEEILKEYVEWLKQGGEEPPVDPPHIYPKECCYKTVVLHEKPKDTCCIKALKEAEKLKEKFLKEEKYRKTHQKIIKMTIIGCGDTHCFDVHEQIKGSKITLTGEDQFLYKITLHLVDKLLKKELTWEDITTFDYYSCRQISDEKIKPEKDPIAKIFLFQEPEKDLWHTAQKNNLKWFKKPTESNRRIPKKRRKNAISKRKTLPSPKAIQKQNGLNFLKSFKVKITFTLFTVNSFLNDIFDLMCMFSKCVHSNNLQFFRCYIPYW